MTAVTESSELTVLVLAAGQGTRMKSALPKVLHPLAGRPLLYYPIRAAFDAGAEHAVIVTSGRGEIETELSRHFPAAQLSFVVQEQASGTGDAARIGLERVRSERVLLVYGDTPLIHAADLSRLVASVDANDGPALALMSCEPSDPRGYGRVLRSADGSVLEVREDRDLQSAEERAVCEVNAGVYAAKTELLRQVVARIQPDNAQREYYFTDAIRLLGEGRSAALLGDVDALLGVNDRAQLAEAEARMFARIRRRHALLGVTLRGDVWIDDSVELGEDVVLEPGVRLRGKTRIGRGAFIDVGCVLDDVEIGEKAWLKPYSVMTSSQVGANTQIGPFSHLRPESRIEDGAHLGNFVETKKTRVRKGAKANHLAYLGDTDIGENANVGAGVIVCNYDGYQKHQSVIGEGAFIGSDSQIVSPVTIGKGAYVATGTTVTQDVPEDALAIGRARQENKPGYGPKIRARFKAARDAKKI